MCSWIACRIWQRLFRRKQEKQRRHTNTRKASCELHFLRGGVRPLLARAKRAGFVAPRTTGCWGIGTSGVYCSWLDLYTVTWPPSLPPPVPGDGSFSSHLTPPPPPPYISLFTSGAVFRIQVEFSVVKFRCTPAPFSSPPPHPYLVLHGSGKLVSQSGSKERGA